MNDVIDAPDRSAERLASLKTLTLVCYILYGLSWLTGVSGLVAIVINYVKRDDTRGTIYESHFTWQIRTFWIGLAIALIGFVTAFIMIGFLILFAGAVWSIYRLVKGFLNWNDNKPMPV